ncbi:response regulator [Isoptericola sp. NPDC019482]|uniref:response regulator n=1 Tax=Isoptericola sp. NPDC019482 TaxID=3154688 RepID=UPI00347E0EBC
MSDDIWVAIIETSPLWLTIVAIVFLVLHFRQPLTEKLLSANRLAIGGFELESAGAALTTARADAPVPGLVARALVRRTKERADDLVGLRILWVDDHPSGNRHERRYFRAAGITVVNALDTESALRELRTDDYDIVITDFRRGNDPAAGPELATRARGEGYDQPFVAYLGHVEPGRAAPQEFLRITDRPDDLVTAVLDVADSRTA